MRLIEPYAGIAAYTVRAMALEAQRVHRRRFRLEPPVSRMGSKAGFAAGVFRAFGLTSARWSGFWLNDLDPVCHLFHLVYASSELREAVARRICAMVPCPECHPDVVAQALEGKVKPTPESMLVQWQTTHADWIGREDKCSYCNDTGTYNDRRLWERLRKEAVPDEIVEAAARAFYLQSRSFQLTPVSMTSDGWVDHGFQPETRPDDPGRNFRTAAPRWTLGERINSSAPASGLTVTRQDAALCLPTGDSSDCVVILDPPYEDTSGYASTSCRADVLMLARAWSDAGALVLLHEACPLADELGKGWQSRSASILRANRSTFWKGEEREIITMNRQPCWWPAIQEVMF